jgi:hypothetical protein
VREDQEGVAGDVDIIAWRSYSTSDVVSGEETCPPPAFESCPLLCSIFEVFNIL